MNPLSIPISQFKLLILQYKIRLTSKNKLKQLKKEYVVTLGLMLSIVIGVAELSEAIEWGWRVDKKRRKGVDEELRESDGETGEEEEEEIVLALVLAMRFLALCDGNRRILKKNEEKSSPK